MHTGNARPERVRPGYWRGFWKQNDHMLVSKKGQKYELDRSVWSTYAKFSQMYDLVDKELVDADVVKHREEAVWMDIDGKVG